MTNNLDPTNNIVPVTHSSPAIGRAASTICLLAAIWFFVSPWVYGAAATGSAWNSWIVGVLLFILAAVRMRTPVASAGLSWFNTILGIWVFFSPWIYGYVAHTDRFVNSLCIGVIVFIFSIASAVSSRNRTMTTTMPRS